MDISGNEDDLATKFSLRKNNHMVIYESKPDGTTAVPPIKP
jgi:hypothetical protein